MFIEQISGQNIKIKFDINEKQLLLGDILKITASGKNGVLVQVVGISTAEKNPNFNLAESKILFSIDSSGKFINWFGNIPSQDFIINKLSAKEVLLCSNALNPQNSVPMGTLSLYPDTPLNIEASFLEKPTVIYCDKQSQKDNILNILSCELSKNLEKTVLIDFNNNYSDLRVSSILEAGKNIKLPFDLKGLELIYNKSLSGASPETRATIEDIFIEIENYLSSDEVEFIPFSSFRQAVDSVYETNKITELVLLKNKLSKLHKQGIFADKKQEIISFNENIRNNNLVIVDLSKFPQEWQKELIEFIIDSNTKKYKQKFFLLVDLDKINCEGGAWSSRSFSDDKAFIENLCGKANKNGISPIIITGHESETAVSLLSYATNIIAFAPENTTKITALKDHLIRLKDNEAIITGKVTNNIPLYVNVYDLDALEECNCSDNLIQTLPEIYLLPEGEDVMEQNQSEDDEFPYEAEGLKDSFAVLDEYNEFSEDQEAEKIDTDEDDFNYANQFEYHKAGIELIDNISKLQEEVYLSQKENLYAEDENYSVSSETYEEENEVSSEQETTSKTSSFYDAVESENNYNSSKKYESGFSEEDLLSFVDDASEEENAPSYLVDEEQGDEDFDYSSNEEFQDESILDYGSFYDASEEQNNNAQYDDDIYDEPESASLKTKSAGSSMPDIPIYSTPQSQNDVSFIVNFQEGDKVKHLKYGSGTVIKIIGSSDKRLCSIQFDDVGRRLLDPKMAELEKIG